MKIYKLYKKNYHDSVRLHYFLSYVNTWNPLPYSNSFIYTIRERDYASNVMGFRVL